MLKLGIIQLSIQEGNIEKNCAHIEELVRNHSSDDIDLLCFPELFFPAPLASRPPVRYA